MAVWSREWDAAANRVKNFRPFACFTGDASQGSNMLPDALLGNAHLTAEGGQPDESGRFLVVRRWTAPRDGRITISGSVIHVYNDMRTGDGVRARIVSSRGGEIGSWMARGLTAETRIEGLEVKQGDTIDFAVDRRDDPDYDAFTWAPTIQIDNEKYSSSDEFRGPVEQPLTVWERYAQALLGTNEFAFVD